MNYRPLGNTNLKISEICLGTWVFGSNMWSGSKKDDCTRTISKALDLGINIIDTAPIYGFGRSEEIIGNALKGKRKNVVLATKCGLIWQGRKITKCLAPESIKKEIDASLKRLNTDYIDLYQIHWPVNDTPIEDTLKTMQDIKKAGKVRNIGVCNFSLDLLKKAHAITNITSLQNEYSFLKRQAGESVFDYCAANKISFLAYGPLAGGILTGKYKEEKKFSENDARSFFYKFYSGKGYNKAQKALALFERIADREKAPLSQIAINWALCSKAVTSVLTGARFARQIEINANASSWQLSKESIDALSKFKF